MPSHSLLSGGCANLRDDYFFSDDSFTFTQATSKFGFGGTRFLYTSQDAEPALSSIATQLFGQQVSSQYSPWSFIYSTEVLLFVNCEDFNVVNIKPRFYFSATLKQKVSIIGIDPPGIGQSPSETLFYIERSAGRTGGSGGELQFTSNCYKDQSLWCLSFTAGVPATEYGFAGFEFSLSESGVSGFEWGAFTGPFSTEDVDLGFTEWHKDGYPYPSFSVSLLSRASCQPSAPCYCNLDLTGRTVVFEGQAFTYGSLQQFISDDGFTIWEEGPSAGIFTRDDRRPCDGTVSMRIRKAEVSCSTFDGVPRWFVYLDSECYERESGGCSPTVTASKITLFDGAFSCDSSGYPLGSAHSFSDDNAPPDQIQENISGTLSANCDSENPIPSISFS
jgi:hypothetical protein